MKAYAAYSKNDNLRMLSSSGAIFSILSSYIFSLHGSVYGVAMTEDCYGSRFIRATDENGLAALRGSKYLQAKMGMTFKHVKEDLEAGIFVLFSGTACQINGLRNFLGKEYSNLYLMDVICHGVPSPKLWKKYAIYQEKNMASWNQLIFVVKMIVGLILV